MMAGLVFLGKTLRIELPLLMVLFFALYLIVKGFIFVIVSLDVGSFIDIGAGILLGGAAFFNIPQLISGICASFLLFKGFFSLFAR